MGVKHGSAVDLPVLAAAPALPVAPYVSVYAKSDNKVYGMDASGVETMLSANPMTIADEAVVVSSTTSNLTFQGAGVAVAPGGANDAVVTVAGFVEHTPGARLYLAADFSLTHNVNTILPFSVVEYDQPPGFADPATGSLTIPQDGLYMVTGYVEINGGTVSGGHALASLVCDTGGGGSVLRSMRLYPTTASAVGLVMSCNKKFQAGARLFIQTTQSGGSTRTAVGGPAKCSIEAAFIGPF